MIATLYRRAALADGTSERLQRDVSLIAVDGRIAWIRPADDEDRLPAGSPPVVVDAHGSTIVPGLVDAHAHLTVLGEPDAGRLREGGPAGPAPEPRTVAREWRRARAILPATGD